MSKELLGEVQLTNEEYHAGPGISKSHLDAIDEKQGGSPAHYWHKYINPNREPNEPTAAMIMGTAIHAAILEPDEWKANYTQAPVGINRRTNDGKAQWAAFENENAGKIILTPEDYQTVERCRDAVHTHPVAGPLFNNGKAEQSFFAIDNQTGELVKCRTDWMDLHNGVIVDVKSTDDASPAGFAKSIANFTYYKQPGWYRDVIKGALGEHPPHWVFLAIEKKPPYAVGIYYMSEVDIEWGRSVGRSNLLTINHYKTINEWPDYGHEIRAIELPSWAKR